VASEKTWRKRTAIWIYDEDAKKLKARATTLGFPTLTSYIIHLFVNDVLVRRRRVKRARP
jgi:hypothetical protein